MKQNIFARLGCETVPFTLESFEQYVTADAAKALYAKGLKAISHVPAVKPEHLLMQVSVRPDIFNALQFLISGPHPVLEEKPSDQFGCMSFFWPDTNMPTQSHTSCGQWSKPPLSVPTQTWRIED